MNVVEVLDVSKTYGSHGEPVLKHVDFSLKEGEFTALVGKSGAGKSTLLHILSGIDTPDAGRVLINGEDITKFTYDQKKKYLSHTIGIIFQAFHIIPFLTVAENIAVGQLFLDDLEPKEKERRVADLIKKVGLAKFAEKKASELSGGQRQRIAIARALACSPKLILADEPTGNLDTETGHQIVELLRSLAKEEKTTVLFVTHEEPHLEHVDAVLHIKEGKLKA